MTTTIGFVGLGLMGQGFTQRLAEKGYKVVGFDIDESKVKAAAAWGVQPAKSAAEVAELPTSSSSASSIPRRSRTWRPAPAASPPPRRRAAR